MVPCLGRALVDSGALVAYVFHSHHFMVDQFQLNDILLLLGMSNDTITSL